MKLKALVAVESYKTAYVYTIRRTSAFDILVIETDMGMVAQKRPIWN